MGRRSKNPMQLITPVSSKKQLLNMEAVRAFLGGISEDSLQRLRNDPEANFPKPLQIFAQTPVWSVEQIERFIARQEKVVEAISA